MTDDLKRELLAMAVGEPRPAPDTVQPDALRQSIGRCVHKVRDAINETYDELVALACDEIPDIVSDEESQEVAEWSRRLLADILQGLRLQTLGLTQAEVVEEMRRGLGDKPPVQQ